MREEDPTLYEDASEKGKLLPFEQDLPWSGSVRERFADPDLTARIQGYVEARPDAWIPVKRLPQAMRRRLVARAPEDERMSAWYSIPYEKQIKRYCKGCPIRPLNETNCYMRFSNYPGMDDFREGFLIALLYASTINEERLKNAWFSFPHLDRKKGELPKDKIAELYSILQGTEVNKRPEEFFNRVVQTLESMVPADAESQTEEINLGDAPFADEFVSAFLYRDKPYSPKETRRYLPYFETLREVGDWAIWGTNNADVRHRLISFKERMDTLVTALQVGDKYNLDTFVSY